MTVTRLLLLSALTLLTVSPAMASSHRETPATWQDPCTDHTDLYAWVNDTAHDKLYMIQVYNGLHEPGQGNYQTSLCDDVLYEFHIARGPDSLDPVVTYQVRFSSTAPTPVGTIDENTPVGGGAELLVQLSGITQTYSVTRIDWGSGGSRTRTELASGLPVSPPNIGPRTDRLAYDINGSASSFSIGDADSNNLSLYDGDFMKGFINELDGGAEGRVWVGEADDPFFLDEDAIFDILNLRGPLPTAAGGSAELVAGPKDVFAGFNAMVIALEINTSKLTGTDAAPAHNGTPGDDTLLGIWNTTSRRKVTILRRNGTKRYRGPWRQVSRQGLPLINAGLIGTQDQLKYLRTKPKNDVANFGSYFLCPVLVRDLDFLGAYAALGFDAGTVNSLKCGRTDILDVINLKDIPSAGAHNVTATGDVLRVDLAIDSGFPNGRRLATDVSDVLISLIVAGDPAAGFGDNVDGNDVPFLTEFPFVGVPHEGLAGGHGAPSP